jgi:hypothetical protein
MNPQGDASNQYLARTSERSPLDLAVPFPKWLNSLLHSFFWLLSADRRNPDAKMRCGLLSCHRMPDEILTLLLSITADQKLRRLATIKALQEDVAPRAGAKLRAAELNMCPAARMFD